MTRTLLRGDLAVYGFFVISGYLIFRSARRTDLRQYALRRLRRVMPGLIAVDVVCTVMGALITTAPATTFWPDALKYLIANLTFCTFLHPGLLGVFTSNEYQWVNGVLWTLKIEVGFYALVPLLLRVRVPFTAVAIALYVGAVSWFSFLHVTHYALASQLPGQLSYFMAGALIEHHEAAFRQHFGALLAVALAVILFGWYPAEPAATAILVLGFCLVAPPLVRAAHYGDFSYGTYIWHFPILQFVASRQWGVPLSLLAALSLVALATLLSWHVIEKPWLRQGATPPQPRG